MIGVRRRDLVVARARWEINVAGFAFDLWSRGCYRSRDWQPVTIGVAEMASRQKKHHTKKNSIVTQSVTRSDHDSIMNCF